MGVKVEFDPLRPLSAGNISHFDPKKTWREQPYTFEIGIRSWGMKDQIPGGMAKLRNQQETLLHEVTHLFHQTLGFLDNRARLSEEALKEVEDEIEAFTAETLKTKPEVVDEIVSELSKRPNCHIIYKEPQRTAFYRYHQKLIKKLLSEMSSPDWNNPSHVKLLRLARRMNVGTIPF